MRTVITAKAGVFFICFLALLSGTVATARAFTLTILTNRIGATPDLLAYNLGHFYPGSDTKDWWRYSRVTGARAFVGADKSEDTSGAAITRQADFLARRTALRGDALGTNYIDWPALGNWYETNTLPSPNKIRVNYAFGQLRRMGTEILACITAGTNNFTIASADDWAGKWKLWRHFYAQAFYLGRHFDVRRYQMFNEPDHHPDFAQTDYLQRLLIASDAIQCAIADVNRTCGKSLACLVYAPVITSPRYNSWAQLAVTNRHLNFLGQTDTRFWLFQRYDYHEYNAPVAKFGSQAASLIEALTTAMAPEARFPTAITEFNVHTAARFDAIPETEDSPDQYPRFGSIVVSLVANGVSELYAFKFAQTPGLPGNNYPARKNGMHYVDNNGAPYDVGGITKAGEVWRLFNKGFAPGRYRLDFKAGAGVESLDLLAGCDPATDRYYIFSVNDSSTNTELTVDLSASDIPDNNSAIVEEVSEAASGSVRLLTRVLGGKIPALTQPGNSVWLITVPARPQRSEVALNATDDATVRDGANRNKNYSGQPRLVIRNDPADAANRSAAFIKFHLPQIDPREIQLALLSVHASTITSNVTAQAHVYGLAGNNWSQRSLTWSSAPNLVQNTPAGNLIRNRVIAGQGDSAFFQGQVVCSSTNPAEVQIDVTDFVRACTNSDATFLISQDPRWNVALPSLATGDTQPDGIQIISREGMPKNSGPRLKLIRLAR